MRWREVEIGAVYVLARGGRPRRVKALETLAEARARGLLRVRFHDGVSKGDESDEPLRFIKPARDAQRAARPSRGGKPGGVAWPMAARAWRLGAMPKRTSGVEWTVVNGACGRRTSWEPSRLDTRLGARLSAPVFSRRGSRRGAMHKGRPWSQQPGDQLSGRLQFLGSAAASQGVAPGARAVVSGCRRVSRHFR